VAVNEGGSAAAEPAGKSVALGLPRVGAPLAPRSFGTGFDLAPKPMKVVLNWGRKYSLWVFNFGLACCAIEFIAASMARHDFIRLGVIPFAPGPRQADLMVVSGTVSDKMAPAVKRLYEQMPEPKYVISFGACANCGGPYWDSYAVTKGIDQVIPVDVYVPGCPPRPEALLQGIVKLQEKIAAEGTGQAPGARPARVKPAARPALPKPPRPVKPPKPVKLPKVRAPKAVPQAAPTVELPRPVQSPMPAPAPEAAPTVQLPPVAVPPMAPPAPPAAPDQPTVPVPQFVPPVPPPAPMVDTLTGELPAVEVPATEDVPKVRVPRRHYFRELRRARDHGLSLFDKAARDQEWEYDDES
jgi:NADH-quinone oxidoreductase subunit B